MKAHVLKGSKKQIAETVAQIEGDIHEVIVFIQEPANGSGAQTAEDIFAEMEPFTVRTGGADYSRQSLYTPMDGE